MRPDFSFLVGVERVIRPSKRHSNSWGAECTFPDFPAFALCRFTSDDDTGNGVNPVKRGDIQTGALSAAESTAAPCTRKHHVLKRSSIRSRAPRVLGQAC